MANNLFNMLSVMCDAAVMIADGNWGDTNVAEYVRSHVPGIDPSEVECYRDILHPVIARRQVSQDIYESVEEKQRPLEKEACAIQFALDRNLPELAKLRDEVDAEILECNNYIDDLSRNIQIADVMENKDLEDKMRSDYASASEVKGNLEDLADKIKKLINIIK